jgi:hypothetical protein
MDFVVKDSGKRQEFETGARRDTQEGKTRPDLISPFFIKRLGDVMAKGAIKYDAWNWSKGMPISRFWASANRHMLQYALGDKDEDHLAQAAFNLMAIIHFEEMHREDLMDMQIWKKE